MFEPYPVLRRVIVNTRTDRAFRGVLWRKRRAYLVLRNTEMIRADGTMTVIDGEVVIPAANIDFMQVVEKT